LYLLEIIISTNILAVNKKISKKIIEINII
jgi:hypothetical protein